jgi:hypothetical protein
MAVLSVPAVTAAAGEAARPPEDAARPSIAAVQQAAGDAALLQQRRRGVEDDYIDARTPQGVRLRQGAQRFQYRPSLHAVLELLLARATSTWPAYGSFTS